MLNKLLKARKPEPCSGHNPTTPGPLQNHPGPLQDHPGALKIVHVGGIEERYYMAVPAKRIIDKYPLFHLTRPEFFKQPWDSLVGPDQILLPGQRFLVVPRQTVRKLRRRVKVPAIDGSGNVPEPVANGPVKRVRFLGLEERPIKGPLRSVEKKVNKLGSDGKTMMVRRCSMWEPSLASITEKHGPNE